MVSPATTLPLDLDFYIPLVVFKGRSVPHKMAKDFSKKRKFTYKKNTLKDSSLYRYTNPRIIYNNQQMKMSAPIPGWADALYAAFYNCSVGIITFGLSPDELRLAARRQTFAKNPFEARSKGGYSIHTKYRMLSCPTEEDMETAEVLSQIEVRELDRIMRADLFPHAQQGYDPLYLNDNLIGLRHRTFEKRKRSIISSTHNSWEEYVSGVHKKLFQTFAGDNNDNVRNLLDLVRNQTHDNEVVEIPAASDHGLESGDDEYYEEMLEDISIE